MAINATVHKAEVQISNMDIHYYQTHNLTLARHPSETNERLMIRLIAFALNANEHLQFTKGLSTDDEPELWQRSLTDEIECWIELGQLDEKRVRKACNRSQKVLIYTYQSGSATVWWKQIESKLTRFKNLHVIHFPDDIAKSLAKFCHRNMQLQLTIEDNELWLSDDSDSIQIKPVHWK